MIFPGEKQYTIKITILLHCYKRRNGRTIHRGLNQLQPYSREICHWRRAIGISIKQDTYPQFLHDTRIVPEISRTCYDRASFECKKKGVNYESLVKHYIS